MQESFIQIEELIKSGEIQGRSALEYLRDTGQFAFHGSNYFGQELEPHQAMNNGLPDGQPAVAAVRGIEIPIFRSLINKNRYLKNVKGMQAAWINAEESTNFLVLQDVFNSLTNQDVGYVYAISMSTNPYSALRGEIRFSQTIKPDYSIKTSPQDLPPAISSNQWQSPDHPILANRIITFETSQEIEQFYQQYRLNSQLQ